MTRDDLVAELKATLHDTAAVFTAPLDADFERFLAAALPDLQMKRPRTRLGWLTLAEGVDRYAVAEPDFAALKVHTWGDSVRVKPWEPCYPGSVPRVEAQWDGAAWWLVLDPAPTGVQLAAWGNRLQFWYFGRHVLGDVADETTVNPGDRGLLLLRAQAEAMRELMLRNVSKPVQMRDGFSGTPRNSTPAALHQQLIDEFWRAR